MPEEHHQTVSSLTANHKSKLKVPKIVPYIIVSIIALALGFYSGVKYQKNHQKTIAANLAQSKFGNSGGGYGRRFGGGQRPTFGQTTAISSSSITVSTQSGSSMTFAITSGTVITDNGQTTSTSDISVGETVAIIPSSSSTSQATRILVNPQFGSGNGGGASNQGSNTTAPVTTN